MRTIVLALGLVALAAAPALPLTSIVPLPDHRCEPLVGPPEPRSAAMESFRQKVPDARWWTCSFGQEPSRYFATKVTRSAKGVCRGRLHRLWTDDAAPWSMGGIRMWAGKGPCPAFDPLLMDDQYIPVYGGGASDGGPGPGDTDFLGVIDILERRDALPSLELYEMRQMSGRRWLFGLWRTYRFMAEDGFEYRFVAIGKKVWLRKTIGPDPRQADLML